ncbi:hypothetical protein VTO42DRAFT_7193 [Malbranchea cinnamomea]
MNPFPPSSSQYELDNSICSVLLGVVPLLHAHRHPALAELPVALDCSSYSEVHPSHCTLQAPPSPQGGGISPERESCCANRRSRSHPPSSCPSLALVLLPSSYCSLCRAFGWLHIVLRISLARPTIANPPAMIAQGARQAPWPAAPLQTMETLPIPETARTRKERYSTATGSRTGMPNALRSLAS